MKNTLALLLFLCFGVINAQKVTVENGIVSIDSQSYLKFDNLSEHISLKTLDGKEIATITPQILNNAKTSEVQDPNDRIKSATGPVNYYVISFSDFKLVFETDVPLRKLYSTFHKYNLVQDGKVSEKAAKRISVKVSDEFSGNKPAIKRSN